MLPLVRQRSRKRRAGVGTCKPVRRHGKPARYRRRVVRVTLHLSGASRLRGSPVNAGPAAHGDNLLIARLM